MNFLSSARSNWNSQICLKLFKRGGEVFRALSAEEVSPGLADVDESKKASLDFH